MGYENNGLMQLALQAQKFFLQFGAHNRIDRRKGLVHEQNGGIRRERPRDSHALGLPAGKLGRVALR